MSCFSFSFRVSSCRVCARAELATTRPGCNIMSSYERVLSGNSSQNPFTTDIGKWCITCDTDHPFIHSPYFRVIQCLAWRFGCVYIRPVFRRGFSPHPPRGNNVYVLFSLTSVLWITRSAFKPAQCLKGQFGPNGALYDGWETRRHNPDFDW
jgi:hypothetical protein